MKVFPEMTSDYVTNECPQCGLPHPASNPYCFCKPTIIGWDLSNGVETYIEATVKDGVLTITDQYDIIDHEAVVGTGGRT